LYFLTETQLPDKNIIAKNISAILIARGIGLQLKCSEHYWNFKSVLFPGKKYPYLALDRRAYLSKKEEIGRTIVGLLEQRFPGISSLVEVIDVATPITFERYTGNWKGTFEGWLIAPENSKVLMKPLSQLLPGLNNFYICGQWVEPGGGLPTAIMSGRGLIKTLCKEDRRKFRTV
jgi:phytoene dehydrogenase-like protein